MTSLASRLQHPTNAAWKDHDLDTILPLVAADMARVDSEIRQQLDSDVVLINQLSAYIINSGGKRLRPMLAVLAARACGYEGDGHARLAAIIEFIHTATLLHDDVVDESDMRRGKETANNVWGNAASVLVGDFLYSRAFQMMVTLDDMRVMQILADTTNTIAEGEVMQLLNCGDPDTTEARYMDVIRCKTAKLFEAGTALGAVISKQPAEIEQALGEYGMQLGNAFQLVDDLLDYTSNPEELGKNVGDDLAEGKPTLPLIQAMAVGTDEQREIVRSAITNAASGKETPDIESVMAVVSSTGAIEYTANLANRAAAHAKAALAILPESPHKEALLGLADFAVQRTN